MANCDYTSQELGAYLDGELSAARRDAVAAHLQQGCDGCAAELHEMQRLAALFAEQPAPQAPDGVMQRLHEHVDWLIRHGEFVDLGLLRIARALTGIAACIVVAGALWLTHWHATPVTSTASPAGSSASSSSSPSAWETVAVTLQVDAAASTDPAADWVLAATAQDREIHDLED